MGMRVQRARTILANRPSYLDYRPPPPHSQAKQANHTIFDNIGPVVLTVLK